MDEPELAYFVCLGEVAGLVALGLDVLAGQRSRSATASANSHDSLCRLRRTTASNPPHPFRHLISATQTALPARARCRLPRQRMNDDGYTLKKRTTEKSQTSSRRRSLPVCVYSVPIRETKRITSCRSLHRTLAKQTTGRPAIVNQIFCPLWQTPDDETLNQSP